MERAFRRAQPAASEVLSTLSRERSRTWSDVMHETRGGMDRRLGSYAHSFMRPHFGYPAKTWDDAAHRWMKTGLLHGNAWEVYRDALPREFEVHPEDPIKGNDWMKLHEKNPMFLSRFLNNQGLPLASRYTGLRAGANAQMLLSVRRAKHLGLLPQWGNPYHQRNMKRRPRPRVSAVTTEEVESYRAQWIENERVRQHFAELKRLSSEIKKQRQSTGTEELGGLPHFPRHVNRLKEYDLRVFHYAMGAVNPLDTI